MPVPIQIDYTTLPFYDSRLLSREDRQLYRTLLPSIPYSPELMEFFHTEKRRQQNYERNRRRHLVRMPGTALELESLVSLDMPDPEDLYLEKEERLKIQKQLEAVPKKHRKRFLRYCSSGKSYKAMAEEEGVTEGSIRYSVRLARQAIEKNYLPKK